MKLINVIIASVICLGCGLLAVVNWETATTNGWLIAFTAWTYIVINELTRKPLTA